MRNGTLHAVRYGRSRFWEFHHCIACAWATFVRVPTCASMQILGFNLPKLNSTRQHHCRLCGRACCADCVPSKVCATSFGFEAPVYVCTECISSVTPDEYARLLGPFDCL